MTGLCRDAKNIQQITWSIVELAMPAGGTITIRTFITSDNHSFLVKRLKNSNLKQTHSLQRFVTCNFKPLTDNLKRLRNIRQMRPKFQSKQSVIINASIEKVWEFNQDLSKIADYHPRVNKVELISGKQFREAGMSYQCHLNDGKNTCIEKDIEIIPMEKIVTVFPSDTMGLTKLLPDYVVESTLKKIDDNKTEVAISHFYSSSKFKVWLLNFIIKPRIARETTDTLKAMKDKIENEF